MNFVGAMNKLRMMKKIILHENEKWYLELSKSAGRPAESLEAADEDNQRDIMLVRIEMNRDTLDRINGALLRIETGDYGQCSDCGDPIADIRLAALPFSHRCKSCEEAAEKRARKKFPTPTGIGRFK